MGKNPKYPASLLEHAADYAGRRWRNFWDEQAKLKRRHGFFSRQFVRLGNKAKRLVVPNDQMAALYKDMWRGVLVIERIPTMVGYIMINLPKALWLTVKAQPITQKAKDEANKQFWLNLACMSVPLINALVSALRGYDAITIVSFFVAMPFGLLGLRAATLSCAPLLQDERQQAKAPILLLPKPQDAPLNITLIDNMQKMTGDHDGH